MQKRYWRDAIASVETIAMMIGQAGNKQQTSKKDRTMNVTYAIKTRNIVTVASDTFDGWQETFAFLKAEGVEVNAKKFSDYTGDTIASDMIFYYDGHPEECPVSGPSWMF